MIPTRRKSPSSSQLLAHGSIVATGLPTLLAWVLLTIGLSAFLWDGLMNEHGLRSSRRTYNEAAAFIRDGRVVRIIEGFIPEACDDFHDCCALSRTGRLLAIFCWTDTGVRIVEPIARLPWWLRRLAIVSQLRNNGLSVNVFDSWDKIWSAIPEFANPTPLGDASTSS